MLIARLLDYIAAHERSRADADWSRLKPFFTEDAVHEVSGGPPLGGRWEGRRALIEHLREEAERFDRHFDERVLLPRGAPARIGGLVAFPWRLDYRLDRGTPPSLRFDGTKVATFASDQIELLRDELRPGADGLIREYLRRNLIVIH
jgi:hypothetical protein